MTTNNILTAGTPVPGIKPTQFQFAIDRFPNTNFMVQSVDVPDVSFGIAQYPTPLQDLKFPGEKLHFTDLRIEFLLDQYLQNYSELYAWVQGLSLNNSRMDYGNFINVRRQQLGVDTKSRLQEETSTGTLIALDPLGSPSFTFTFHDLFPVRFGSISFDTQSDNSQYLKCEVHFSYNSFDITPGSQINTQSQNSSTATNGKFNVNLY